MALKVGELYAELSLEDSQYTRGVQTAGRQFDGLRSTVAAGGRAIATGFTVAATAVGALTVSAVRAGIEYNGLRQTASAALETVMGSASGAADQMDRLDDFGRGSWVMRDVLIEAQTQMTGFGIETEKVIPYLDALQEGVAAAGGNNQDFAELAEIMARIKGQSKITAEELNQFGRRGVDAAGIIGEAMGFTGEEIREQITAGTLDADDALDALAEGMKSKFDGATDRVRDTWQGATDNMAAAWRDLGAEVAVPLVDPEGGGYFVEWANLAADALWTLQSQAEPLVAMLTDRFRPQLDAVATGLRAVGDGIGGWDMSNLNAQMDTFTRYAPLAAGLSATMLAIGTSSLPLIGGLINPVAAGFAALAATSPEIRSMLGDVVERAGPLVPLFGEFAGVLAEVATQLLETLTPALGDLLGTGADLAVILAGSMLPAIGSLAEATVPLAEVLADVVTWVAELPTPLLIAGAAFAVLAGPLRPMVTSLQGVGTGLQRIAQQSAVQASLGNTNIAMGGLAASSAAAGPAIGRVGIALKTAFMSNPIGLAIGAITIALAAFGASQAESKQQVQELTSSLDEQTGAWGENTDAIVANALEESGAAEAYDRLGGNVGDLTLALEGNQAAQDRVNEVLGEANDFIYDNTDAWGVQGDAVHESGLESGTLRGLIGDVTDGMGSQSDALDESAEKHERERQMKQGSSDATRDATDATMSYTGALEEQMETLAELAGDTISAHEAEIRYEDAKRRSVETAEEYSGELEQNVENLDLSTEAGARSQESLNRLVDAGLRQVDSLSQQEDGGERARRKMVDVRNEVINQAREFGYTKDAANKYADELGLIPGNVVTEAEFWRAQADADIQLFKNRYQGKTIAWVAVDVYERLVRSVGRGQAASASRYTAQAHAYYNREDGGVQDGGTLAFADGGMTADGRSVDRVPQTVQGGANILWGEQSTGWESYISGKPAARARNMAVMDETARRLGGMFVRPMADGGTLGMGRTTGAVTAVLAPEDRQLLRGIVRLADRPILASLNVGRREMASVVSDADGYAEQRGGLAMGRTIRRS